MTRRIPRCPAIYPTPIERLRCQLETGHNGDHHHTTMHQNATHTIAWTNTGQLTHLRRQP